MAILRYTASHDTTITNAYRSNLTLRGTGSNMGLSDTLEVFSLYGQVSGSDGLSQELSRILMKFPVEDLINDRNSGKLPASGNVSFYLKMTNVRHGFTLPRNATYNVAPITTDWEEGNGLDMEEYLDITRDGSGSNWIQARKGTDWTNAGGDYDYTLGTYYTTTQRDGIEDVEVDISALVEEWIATTRPNYGLGFHLTSSQEAFYSSSLGSNSGSLIHNINGAQESYYTKKFFSRGSEHFFRRPNIEARWNSSVQDDRGNVLFSSSLMTAEDNLNTLYLYNVVRGRLRDIPSVGQGEILVSFYSSSLSGAQEICVPSGSKIHMPVGGGVVANLDQNVTGGWYSTGIYTASFAITSSILLSKRVHDVWHSGGVEFYTASFVPSLLSTVQNSPSFEYHTTITNLRPIYLNSEIARFRLYNRKRNWCPNIYVKAVATPENEIVHSGAYEIFRVSDQKKVIPFGTGSDLHTMMSYDTSGSYFDLDMSLLEPDFAYGVRFAFYDDDRNTWEKQNNEFKFRIQ